MGIRWRRCCLVLPAHPKNLFLLSLQSHLPFLSAPGSPASLCSGLFIMRLEVELYLTPLLGDFFFFPSDLVALCPRSLPANLFWIGPLSILEAPPPRQPREAQPLSNQIPCHTAAPRGARKRPPPSEWLVRRFLICLEPQGKGLWAASPPPDPPSPQQAWQRLLGRAQSPSAFLVSAVTSRSWTRFTVTTGLRELKNRSERCVQSHLCLPEQGLGYVKVSVLLFQIYQYEKFRGLS